MSPTKIYEKFILRGVKWHEGGMTPSNTTYNIRYEGEIINGKLNGKGEKYDKYDNILKFKGEYLNGKRNGKGKKFLCNKVVFEGEYLNDRGNGQEKEYFYNTLIYEGEYSNWKRNGRGKEYENNGNIIFKGEFNIGKGMENLMEIFLMKMIKKNLKRDI